MSVATRADCDLEARQSLSARSVRAGGLGRVDQTKSWKRQGLKPWIDAAKKRLHRNVLAIALANTLPASPGVFLLVVEPSK
jgi:hypothetical protein